MAPWGSALAGLIRGQEAVRAEALAALTALAVRAGGPSGSVPGVRRDVSSVLSRVLQGAHPPPVLNTE